MNKIAETVQGWLQSFDPETTVVAVLASIVVLTFAGIIFKAWEDKR